MKCQHQILNIYHRGYDTNPCQREATYRITYMNGNSECICGRCKGSIIRSIKADGYEYQLPYTKIEKI